MLRALLAGLLALSACGGGEVESQPVAQATPQKDAGEVVELTGKVTVSNAGAARPLAVGNPVAADDVIDTGGDGAVVIEAGITSRVDASVAWAKTIDQATSSAGRHADRVAEVGARADVHVPVRVLAIRERDRAGR